MAQDSKRYKALRTKVEHMKLYPVQDALKIIKENATAKFDESVAAHRSRARPARP